MMIIENSPEKCGLKSSLLTWMKDDPNRKYRSRSAMTFQLVKKTNEDRKKVGILEQRLFNQ